MTWAPLVLIDLCVAIYYRGNIIKLISYQSYVVMLLCLLIDIRNGDLSWSLHWVIPITLVVLTIVTFIIGAAGGLRIVDYMIYLIIDVTFSLLQLIPVLLKINKVPFAAISSIGIMVIIAAYVAIFRPEELGNAFTKYMNV